MRQNTPILVQSTIYPSSRQHPSILGGRDYYHGALIEYLPFGASETRVISVNEISDDIKNGCPGFSGNIVITEGNETRYLGNYWGYDDQILRVINIGTPPEERAYHLEIPKSYWDDDDAIVDPDDPATVWTLLPVGRFYTAAEACLFAECEVGVPCRVIRTRDDSTSFVLRTYQMER